MTTATMTPAGYRFTQTDDLLVVHGVPIFVDCKQGDMNFDAKWVQKAVAKAFRRQKGDYLPPVHVRHHNDGDAPIEAGHFKVTGSGPIEFEGAKRTAIFADIYITNPGVAHDIIKMRLPYRSVEIRDVSKPGIDSLALLDHEAPFLELPMLRLNVEDNEGPGENPIIPGGIEAMFRTVALRDIADATFQLSRSVNDGPMVACFQQGAGAQLLLHDTSEIQTMKTAAQLTEEARIATEAALAAVEAEKAAKFAADEADKEGDDDGDGEGADMEGDEGDGKDIVKLITSGKITLEMMDAIEAAIAERRSASAPDETTAPDAVQPTGPEAMSAKPTDNSAKFSALEAQLATQDATIKALLSTNADRDASVARDADVNKAIERLKGRPMGANLRSNLTEYHTKFGGPAFASHVDTLAETFGLIPRQGGDPVDFKALPTDNSVAMKYADKPEAVQNAAAKFSANWRELDAAGLAGQDEAAYVDVNMRAAQLITTAR